MHTFTLPPLEQIFSVSILHYYSKVKRLRMSDVEVAAHALGGSEPSNLGTRATGWFRLEDLGFKGSRLKI